MELVVFWRDGFACGDRTVRVLGLGSRVRGNDGVGLFGNEVVGVLAGRASVPGFALVSRDSSFVGVFSWHVHLDCRVPGDSTHVYVMSTVV